MLRVVPPEKRLHPHDLACGYRGHGLVEDRQLLVGSLQCSPEIALQLEAAPGSLVHSRVEYPESSTLLFDPVHCRVGVPEKALRCLRPGIAQADADAGRGEQLFALEIKRSLELFGDPLGHPHHLFEVFDVLYKHDELVAPETSQAIPGAQAALEALGHDREEQVPSLVAQRVVYDLELVEVHKQHSHLLALPAPGAVEGLPKAVHKELAVREICQVVVEGPML